MFAFFKLIPEERRKIIICNNYLKKKGVSEDVDLEYHVEWLQRFMVPALKHSWRNHYSIHDILRWHKNHLGCRRKICLVLSECGREDMSKWGRKGGGERRTRQGVVTRVYSIVKLTTFLWPLYPVSGEKKETGSRNGDGTVLEALAYSASGLGLECHYY